MNAGSSGFKGFEESNYDLRELEANGFEFNPYILNVNGNYGLIYQKRLYQEKSLQNGINFHEAKELAEKSFNNLLKKPRLPTSGEWSQIFSADKTVQDNLWKSRAYEWVDGMIEKGIFYDRLGKANLPESGYIQSFDSLRGIPIETGKESNRFFGDEATFFYDKECDAPAMLRSSFNEWETIAVNPSCLNGSNPFFYRPILFSFRVVSSF